MNMNTGRNDHNLKRKKRNYPAAALAAAVLAAGCGVPDRETEPIPVSKQTEFVRTEETLEEICRGADEKEPNGIVQKEAVSGIMNAADARIWNPQVKEAEQIAEIPKTAGAHSAVETKRAASADLAEETKKAVSADFAVETKQETSVVFAEETEQAEHANSEPEIPTVSEALLPETEGKSFEERMEEYFCGLSEEEIRTWFLRGFEQKRAELGVGAVPESEVLNRQCQEHAERCANQGMYAHSSAMGIWYDLWEYESVGPVEAWNLPDGKKQPGEGTYEESAVYYGGRGGWIHCPGLYTEQLEAVGIGVAKDYRSRRFVIVIQGYDSGWN